MHVHSGIGDLFNPWAPGAGGARVGFLYKPVRGVGKKGWRWTWLAREIARAQSLGKGAPGWLGFFTDESEALSFLTSGESPSSGPTPQPTAGG